LITERTTKTVMTRTRNLTTSLLPTTERMMRTVTKMKSPNTSPNTSLLLTTERMMRTVTKNPRRK
ncbi:hypothetical protein HDU91_004349, partial [Kappamyces sp. JEL0680]